MSALLNHSTGRLTYSAHLSHPGVEIPYDEETGLLVAAAAEPPIVAPSSSAGALKRPARYKPARTHQAGYGPDGGGGVIDYISVWGHATT
ncbi:hypothetical protein B0T17DRAFT_516683 [Bombardia bombarda]|uniref:Uncharacterized protein n=1 Tax=Bombardia bombarda TaxID=252184 RepID=A0AA39XL17_9PEZI|nr:hypothetical protein B0T17DRAFT_516683 [Bombardia bombarda]